jgi:hypothetical protein
MKKIIIILFIFSNHCLFSQGENKFYVYGLTGYKFGSVYTTFPNEYLLSQDGVSNSYIRLGGGNNFTAAGGWMFHKNFGCEVSGTYTLGIQKTISDKNLTNQSFLEYSKTSNSKNFHAIGSLVAQTKVLNFHLYAKAGIVIGLMNQSNIAETFKVNGISESVSYQYNGTIMRGFNGSLGILYPLSKNLSLMFEAEEVSIQGEFKNATLNSNNSSIAPPNEIVFVENTSGTISTATTNYQRAYPVSYSCIGLNIGIHYSFK